MPSEPDSRPLDKNGRPLTGRALQVYLEGEAKRLDRERRELEERERHVRAWYRFSLQLASMVTGLPALDAVAVVAAKSGGVFDPDELLRGAGMTPAAGPLASSWRGEAAARPAQVKSDFWSQFPDHSDAYLRGERSLEAVSAEYAGRQAQREAREQQSVLWRTRSGEQLMGGMPAVMGASYGSDGAARQVSRVNQNVPALGSEEV